MSSSGSASHVGLSTEKPGSREPDLSAFMEHSATIRFTHQMSHGPFIATPKAFAVFILQLRRHIRIPVLIAVIGVGSAVVFSVSPCAFHSVLKASALDLAEHRGRNIPHPLIRPAHHLGHGLLITPPEAFPIFAHKF